MKKAPALVEASPYKSVAKELETFRRTFRTLCQCYAERVDMEIVRLRERVVEVGATAAAQPEQDVGSGRTKKATALHGKQADALAQIHNLRDMLILLRTLSLKPADGRRKDLKKVEAVIEELQTLVKDWG